MDGFEWDDAKDVTNLAKHGISFNNARRIFEGGRIVTRNVSRPEDNEERLASVGLLDDRLVYICFTWRPGGVRRIISVRRANRRERDWYDTGKSDHG